MKSSPLSTADSGLWIRHSVLANSCFPLRPHGHLSGEEFSVTLVALLVLPRPHACSEYPGDTPYLSRLAATSGFVRSIPSYPKAMGRLVTFPTACPFYHLRAALAGSL